MKVTIKKEIDYSLMKQHIYAGIIFVVSLALDIITKEMIVSTLQKHERVDILGTFVQFTLIYNRGGLFGILQGYQALFLSVSVIVLIMLVLFYIFEKNKTTLFCTSMALIASGAVGNILDRFLGMFGFADRPGVVDFIWIGHDSVFRWPAFNIADAVIVVGAVMLVIAFYKSPAFQEQYKKEDTETENE